MRRKRMTLQTIDFDLADRAPDWRCDICFALDHDADECPFADLILGSATADSIIAEEKPREGIGTVAG